MTKPERRSYKKGIHSISKHYNFNELNYDAVNNLLDQEYSVFYIKKNRFGIYKTLNLDNKTYINHSLHIRFTPNSIHSHFYFDTTTKKLTEEELIQKLLGKEEI